MFRNTQNGKLIMLLAHVLNAHIEVICHLLDTLHKTSHIGNATKKYSGCNVVMNVLMPEFLFSMPTSATITDTNELKTFAALKECLGHRVWILHTWS